MLSCDSVLVNFVLVSPSRTSASPYTVTVTTATASFSNTFNATFDNNGLYYGQIGVSGVTSGDSANVFVVNACGDSAYAPILIADWGYNLYFQQQVSTCGIDYYIVPDFWASNYTSSTYFNNYPFTVQVWDSTNSVLFDSTTLTYGMGYPPHLLTPGHTYSINISDDCGHSILKSFVAPIIDTPRVTTYVLPYSCSDSTASVHIEGFNFTSRPTLTILSGPSVAHSSNPYFSHWDTITYPTVRDDPFNGCAGYSPPSTCYQLGGLPVGTYQYTLHDTCGHIIAGSFTVGSQDVAAFAYQKKITRGCPGQNKISYDLYIANGFFPGNIKIKQLNATSFFDTSNAYILTVDSSVIPTTYKYSGNHTFDNLNAGTYVLESLPEDNTYSFPYVKTLVSFGMSCSVFRDTIVITPYRIPLISYATQIKCNGRVNVGLQPDSITGVPPYKYEILSGPQAASIQASPFFTLSQQGNYVARISDTCGFASTFSFFVDTLSFHQVVKVGSSCLGNSATLVSEHSPYATYVWQKPNGSFYTGDSLHINPVLPTDYGIYHIKKIVSVNGCSDTFYATYTLNSSSVTYLSATACNGQGVMFAGIPRAQAGVYYDTIPNAFCDSVVVLYLSTSGTTYNFVTRPLCAGDSVRVGNHIYKTAGTYRDTLTSVSGCDSIYILNLTVVPVRRDTLTQTICSGQRITVGSHYYDTAGTYIDTLTAVSGCDSIRVLNLYVSRQNGTGFVMKYICSGDSFLIGNTYQNTTGYYQDTLHFGCDSITLFYLNVGYKFGYEIRNLCSGYSLVYGGKTYTNAGVYRDTFATATCDSIFALVVHADSVKTFTISQTICAGQSVIAGSHVYTASGTYRDTFATNGCDSIRVLNLIVTNTKRDTFSRTICATDSFLFDGKYRKLAGLYSDTILSASNCDSIRVLNLTVTNVKRDTVSSNICFGQSVVIGMKIYSQTGTYQDTFATANCDSIRVLNLLVLPTKRDTISVIFCEGERISIGNRTFTQTGYFTDTFATNDCDSLRTVHVTTFALPVIQVTASETTTDIGNEVQLNVAGSKTYSYLWTSSATLSNVTIQNPTAIISESSWVIVQATDANNCKAFDSLFITVKDCEGTIYVPNAFTPNGDERNDGYRIFGKCIKLNRLMIFNRWGEKVWETNNIEQEWNGYYKSVLQPTGVYVYWLSYSLGDEKVRELKGSITLIR
jgi:gliding motility-associated-like protein